MRYFAFSLLAAVLIYSLQSCAARDEPPKGGVTSYREPVALLQEEFCTNRAATAVSAEQSSGTGQITTAVVQINQIAQQNSRAADALARTVTNAG